MLKCESAKLTTSKMHNGNVMKIKNTLDICVKLTADGPSFLCEKLV